MILQQAPCRNRILQVSFQVSANTSPQNLQSFFFARTEGDTPSVGTLRVGVWRPPGAWTPATLASLVGLPTGVLLTKQWGRPLPAWVQLGPALHTDAPRPPPSVTNG
eukprot:6146826-Amphidinium_carterae.1